MPKLTEIEVNEFLEEPGHLLRVGNVDSDGMPRVVPIWFVHVDGEILFTPRGPAVFLANIRRGHAAPPELLSEVRRRYEAIGGQSPLNFDGERHQAWILEVSH